MTVIPTACPHCGSQVLFQSGKETETVKFRNYYYCIGANCGARVACHRGTKQPLGTMARPQLRQWRNDTHQAFDPLWQSKLLTRDEAYRWLAWQLDLNLHDAHIGLFNEAQCQRAIAVIETLRSNILRHRVSS